MKAIPNSTMLFRLLGMLVLCWAIPPLVCHYAGSAAGALAAAGAAALWYSQYRLPTWSERSGSSFWFVAGGYGFIGLTLAVCLGRLLRVSL
jgi:hypothetical protein